MTVLSVWLIKQMWIRKTFVCIGSVCWGDQWQNCDELWIGQWVLLTCVFKGCAMIFLKSGERLFLSSRCQEVFACRGRPGVKSGFRLSAVIFMHGYIDMKKLKILFHWGKFESLLLSILTESEWAWRASDYYRPECRCCQVPAIGELDLIFE